MVSTTNFQVVVKYCYNHIAYGLLITLADMQVKVIALAKTTPKLDIETFYILIIIFH